MTWRNCLFHFQFQRDLWVTFSCQPSLLFTPLSQHAAYSREIHCSSQEYNTLIVTAHGVVWYQSLMAACFWLQRHGHFFSFFVCSYACSCWWLWKLPLRAKQMAIASCNRSPWADLHSCNIKNWTQVLDFQSCSEIWSRNYHGGAKQWKVPDQNPDIILSMLVWSRTDFTQVWQSRQILQCFVPWLISSAWSEQARSSGCGN